VRTRLGRVDRRVRVLCVAHGAARNGNVSDSTLDGFSGWSESYDGEESVESQRKKWFGGNESSGYIFSSLFVCSENEELSKCNSGCFYRHS
jgi:hypothetical protein